MKSKMVLLMIVCALCAVFSNTALGQAAPKAEPTPEPQPLPKGFKTVILEVKNRDTSLLANVLRGLASGERYSQVSANSEFKTITVRDYPENIAVMQDALKRLDVAEAEKPNLEVQLYLIVATPTAAENEPLLPQLEPVIRQLRGTLKYKGYRHVTTFINRAKVGAEVNGSGKINLFGQPTSISDYAYNLRDIRTSKDGVGNETIQVGRFALVLGAGRIETELSLREGEMVAVGTSSIGDNGVIAVVSVKKVQ